MWPACFWPAPERCPTQQVASVLYVALTNQGGTYHELRVVPAHLSKRPNVAVLVNYQVLICCWLDGIGHSSSVFFDAFVVDIVAIPFRTSYLTMLAILVGLGWAYPGEPYDPGTTITIFCRRDMNRYLRWKWRELANQDDERKREEETRYRLTHRRSTCRLL